MHLHVQAVPRCIQWDGDAPYSNFATEKYCYSQALRLNQRHGGPDSGKEGQGMESMKKDRMGEKLKMHQFK